MKTIGMIGGMSWQSTTSYYQAINEATKSKLGGLNSAKVILNSVNFAEIERLQHAGKWHETADILSRAAQSIERAGADFVLICTNTMHKVADDIQQNISIPIIHIADATASKLVNDGVTKVGLIGTRFTMEQDFYKRRLIEQFDIDVIVPLPPEQAIIHDIIYDELCQGIINPGSKDRYLEIVNSLHENGAQAVILGCTEIALLIDQQDTNVPLYDTTQIHAQYAVELALSASNHS